MGGMLWFSFIWLALAAGLIWVVAFLIRRDANSKTGNSNVKILAQHSLGPRERVVVVNVLDRILVLGHTPSQINLITELDPEDVANISTQPKSIDFSLNLASLLKRLPN